MPIQLPTATLEKDPMLCLTQLDIMEKIMLFSQGQSYHQNHICAFIYQLYYDQMRKKNQHCIYIYPVPISVMHERLYDFVLVEADLRLSWHLFLFPTRASILLAYTQHVQLLGHLFHGYPATILNFSAFQRLQRIVAKKEHCVG